MLVKGGTDGVKESALAYHQMKQTDAEILFERSLLLNLCHKKVSHFD